MLLEVAFLLSRRPFFQLEITPMNSLAPVPSLNKDEDDGADNRDEVQR